MRFWFEGLAVMLTGLVVLREHFIVKKRYYSDQ